MFSEILFEFRILNWPKPHVGAPVICAGTPCCGCGEVYSIPLFSMSLDAFSRATASAEFESSIFLRKIWKAVKFSDYLKAAPQEKAPILTC